MKCVKNIVITAYKVQYVDLREEKPRTPRELTHAVDSAWLEAVGLLGQSPIKNITELYERIGYKVFSVERIMSKCVVTLDLNQLYTEQVAKQEALISDQT